MVAKPICPATSYVGTTGIDAGSGPNPLHVNGNVYLAGPYKGAPVSLVFVTPALAGPFDLGAVIVRVALNVNPETARVHAVSDTIPDVFGGAKLGIRKIDVSMSRKKFTLNPTNCRKSPDRFRDLRRRRQPARPGELVEDEPGEQIPGHQMRQARVPARLHRQDPRRRQTDPAGGEPEVPRGPRRSQGRRQREAGGVHPAAGDDPRSGPHQDDLHESPARRERLPQEGDLRTTPERRRRC